MVSDRRSNRRIPVDLPVTQYVDNRPIASLVSNLSATGLHARHIVEPLARSSRLIQLEFSLPGSSEPLWVKGEVVYDTIGPRYHGTGIRFLAMAPAHERVLTKWILGNKQDMSAARRGGSSRSLRV